VIPPHEETPRCGPAPDGGASERESGPAGRSRLFPEGFLWGAATSAYQIEGSPLADGAGASNWHRFSHTPGRILDCTTGDIACDHYRRFPEDVAIMRKMCLTAYRFSLSWSRILPSGRGRVNRAGAGFYSRLIDLLLSSGIEPFVTLHHWDLPAALDDAGGWTNRDCADWFAEYSEKAFRLYGDRVRFWTTLNEPWVIADAGYLHGVHAPGHASVLEAPVVAHHLLLAHASAVRAYRGGWKGMIGLVVNLEPKDPSSDSPEDEEATRRADAYMNRQYLDPIFFGRYPEEMQEIFGSAWPDVSARDLERIREPIDFLGINYYTRGVVRRDDSVVPLRAANVRLPESRYTELGWEVRPESLTKVLCWVRDRYGSIPLFVTENGAAFSDPPEAGGDLVQDPLRVDYFRRHIIAARAALEKGVDLRGYFAWSLLDNFEWSQGYSIRFGLVHVDYETQLRTPKASARFYQEVIRTRGAALDAG
jgi:beta-glucosidase